MANVNRKSVVVSRKARLMSKAQRSAAAKRAAKSAWATMRSKAYVRASNISPKAVAKYLANR